MRTLNLPQGSPEWLAHRRTTRNASDAPAMMGASPYVTRSELVKQYATGITREIDAATQARFDKGHEVEPALRALAEKIIGEDLYPVTGVSDDGYLGASFDGVTLDETVIFEAKQSSAEKRKWIADGIIPPADYWQVCQQFAVCEGATRCLYLCGDGTEACTSELWIDRDMVSGDIQRLLAGWQQFDADVAAYVPEPEKAQLVASKKPSFGVLSLRIEGRVLASNLDAFKADADDFIASLPKPEDLTTDQDFIDAEAAIKACEDAEARIKAAKEHAQAQMTDVDAVFRMADTIQQMVRTARLAMDKAVKAEKENRKADIVANGAKAVRAHYDTINETLGEHRIQPPQSLQLDLGAAIKGKKSLTSMKDAVDTAVAGFKIAASEQADRVRANVRVFEAEVGSWAALFPDHVALCATKAQEDLRNLMTARITQAKADEQKRADDAKAREEAVQSTTGAEASAAAEPDATEPARAPAAVVSVGRAGAAPTPAGAKVKLGDINARIAPLTITADGLRQLGFEPAGRDRSATLYREVDFPQICHGMAKVLEQATQKKAA